MMRKHATSYHPLPDKIRFYIRTKDATPVPPHKASARPFRTRALPTHLSPQK